MAKPENPLKRADGTMIDGKECEAFPLSSQKFQQLSQDGAPTLPLMNVRQRGKKKTLFDEEKVTRQTVFDSEKVSSVEPEESKFQPDEATILSIGDVQIEKEDNGDDTVAEKVFCIRAKKIIAELEVLKKAKQELDWKVEQKVKREEMTKQKKAEKQKKEEKRLNKNNKNKK